MHKLITLICLFFFIGLANGQIPAWEHLGPFKQTVPMYSGESPHGIGKVQCLAVKSKRVIYAGSNTSGIYKTKNKGKTWKNILDYNHLIGVQDIEVHPKKKRTIFIATGTNPYNNKNYGIGVLKSTNAGRTWKKTGLSFTPDEFNQTIVRKVKVHPSLKNIVYACTDDKIYKSNDLGETWKVFLESKKANFRDIEINPFSDSNIHVLGRFWYFSNDLGENWEDNTTEISKGMDSPAGFGRIELTFSLNQEDLLAVGMKSQGNSIAISIDGGKTVSYLNRKVNSFRIDEHTMSLEFINDSKELVVGGVRIGKVKNLVTGDIEVMGSREGNSSNFIHDDIRELQYYKGLLYAANDGGIAAWDEEEKSWDHITGKGLAITQFYGISNNNTDPYFLLGGTQDMSSQMLKDGEWYNQTKLYGDGGKAFHHPEKFNELWSVRSGVLFHSTDTAKTWKWDSPRGSRGPFNSGIKYGDGYLYYYSTNVFKKNLSLGKWTNTTKSLNLRRNLSAFDLFKGNPNIQIFSEEEPLYNKDYKGKLFLTRDGGDVWEDITAYLPVLAWMQVTDLLFHPTDSNQIWASIGLFHGAEKKDKLYHTLDGGKTWKNVSSNLPSYPTTCLFYKDDLLFVGTDIGLYYMKIGDANFKEYGENLPKVYISEILYNEKVNKLRVATFGMGLWEVDFIKE